MRADRTRSHRQGQPLLHLAVQNWKVHDRPARLTHLIQSVGDDPDDFVIGVTARSDVEMLSQRVFAEEVLLRQLVADDNGLRMAGCGPR